MLLSIELVQPGQSFTGLQIWWAHLNSHALMRLQLGFPWSYLERGVASFYKSFQTGQYVCRVVYL